MKAIKNKLKTLAKVSKQRSRSRRWPIVFRGGTATATNDTTELTLRLPIVWIAGDEAKLDADDVLKIAACLEDSEELRIEVSGDYATVNGVRALLDGMPVGTLTPSDEERTELEVTEELRAAVEDVRACVADDPLRPVLGGIYIDSAMVAATDAHVLAWRDIATGLPDGVKAVIYPDMFDLLPDGCRTIKVGDKYNVAESDAGRVVSRRPGGGSIYPNVRAVIPAKHDGAVTLDARAVRDTLQAAKTRKLVAAALVIRDGSAGMELYESLNDPYCDMMRVSLPCSVEKGSRDVVVGMKIELLERALGKTKHDRISVQYRDENTAVVVNGCALVMPITNKFDHGKDFIPDRVELPEGRPETPKRTEETEKQRIVELPDGTFIVIGGTKPKGGREVKSWIIDEL